MSATCEAWADGYPRAHTCDDPAACGLASMVAERDPRDEELETLHDLLDRIEELCEDSKAKVAETVLTAVHQVRGGPR